MNLPFLCFSVVLPPRWRVDIQKIRRPDKSLRLNYLYRSMCVALALSTILILTPTTQFTCVIYVRQTVLLLALFLKPLLGNEVANNRSMATYRRIFVRNVVCTMVIILVLVTNMSVGYIFFNSHGVSRKRKVRGITATRVRCRFREPQPSIWHESTNPFYYSHIT